MTTKKRNIIIIAIVLAVALTAGSISILASGPRRETGNKDDGRVAEAWKENSNVNPYKFYSVRGENDKYKIEFANQDEVYIKIGVDFPSLTDKHNSDSRSIAANKTVSAEFLSKLAEMEFTIVPYDTWWDMPEHHAGPEADSYWMTLELMTDDNSIIGSMYVCRDAVTGKWSPWLTLDRYTTEENPVFDMDMSDEAKKTFTDAGLSVINLVATEESFDSDAFEMLLASAVGGSADDFMAYVNLLEETKADRFNGIQTIKIKKFEDQFPNVKESYAWNEDVPYCFDAVWLAPVTEPIE